MLGFNRMTKDLSFKPLKVSAIPVPKGNEHPPAPFPQLPDHEFTLGKRIDCSPHDNLDVCAISSFHSQFTLGLIAPKGSGKTTMICNLLMFYKKHFHNILIFSPTINSDDKWDYIKEKDLLLENVPLKKFLKSLEDKKKKNQIVQSIEEPTGLEGFVNQKEFFSPKIQEEHFYTDYSDNALSDIIDEQNNVILMLKKHGKPKHLANRILIIFDDLVGSSLFAGSKGAYFTGFNTRHRHSSISMMMVTQGYKEIPKTIRSNWTAIIVFKIGNQKEVEVIYEEFNLGMNYKDWLEVYRYCTKEPHGFIYMNVYKEEGKQLMKNFDEYLFVRPPDEGGVEVTNV
jgi:hypothetical protein